MSLADAPDVYVLSVREPGKASGGGVAPYRLFTPDAPLVDLHPSRLTPFHRPLMMIHGFNDDLAFAQQVYGCMYNKLVAAGLFESIAAPDVIIHFHWPGDVGVDQSLVDAALYAIDLKQCKESSVQLAQFFQVLNATAGSARTTTVITHSMGGRVLLECLRRLGAVPEFTVIALMAAAVPSTLAQQGEPLAGTAVPPRLIYKYHSSSDMVLSQVFWAGQLSAWMSEIETHDYDEAIGSYGLPVTFGLDTQDWLCGHSEYWSNPAVACDIASRITPTLRVGLAARPKQTRAPATRPAPGTKR